MSAESIAEMLDGIINSDPNKSYTEDDYDKMWSFVSKIENDEVTLTLDEMLGLPQTVINEIGYTVKGRYCEQILDRYKILYRFEYDKTEVLGTDSDPIPDGYYVARKFFPDAIRCGEDDYYDCTYELGIPKSMQKSELKECYDLVDKLCPNSFIAYVLKGELS